ncbi:NAD-dependent epimerase/dehydratase family protein [Mariniflexile ostreae]|uniref:NAD-dependent epimerase/dehydratase family protein n=1 Tax=Mariniflexile ostreae TaxID=1520892 RepID=A0ABV5F7M9_9FLAO
MILVTGSTGLLGSHLLYKLASQNKNIRALYRTEDKLDLVKNVFATYTAKSDSLFNSIEWVKADILDIPALTNAFKAVNYVYHCAALVSFDPNDYPYLRKTNIEGTANIVNLCLAHKIEKLCYVSSVATLGSALKNELTTEETYWNPEDDNNVYAITKYGAEMEVWRASQEGLPVVIVKPGVILGAGVWNQGSGSLFTKAHKGLRFYPKGNSGLVDVKDVADAMIQLLKSDIKNEAFILVSENWNYKHFLQALATSVGAKPPSTLAPTWVLAVLWRLDWLKNALTGTPRQLTKQLAASIMSKSHYSNAKIKTALHFKFKPVQESINEIGAIFQKQVE